ncbi:hypothetical protein Bca4012_075835 [Brassica carinata]
MSLKRLRSTCKRWNALFKDSRFTDKHFLKAGKQSLVLTLKVSGVMLASFSLNVDDLSIEIKVQLSLKDSHSGSVCLLDIFHCNGLLLCTTTRNNRIVVCNPWLGETRWIQIKPDYVGRSTSGSWRVLDVDTLDWFLKPRGVSLKGNAYWLASQKYKTNFLQSLDFTRAV